MFRPSRRSFLAGAGAAGTAAVLAGCSGGSVTPGAPITPPTNPVVPVPDRRPELRIEPRVSGGGVLSSGGDRQWTFFADAGAGAGTVTGGAAVAGLTPIFQEYLNEIAQNELNHVRFLQSAIKGNSGTPVSRPNIDFTNAFNALASAAGIASTFNPFSSFNAFLVGAFVFEDVGVTAYHGAAPLLQNNNILKAAASIMAVEAYHAAEVRTLLVGVRRLSTIRRMSGMRTRCRHCGRRWAAAMRRS